MCIANVMYQIIINVPFDIEQKERKMHFWCGALVLYVLCVQYFQILMVE
eukprot:UN18474